MIYVIRCKQCGEEHNTKFKSVKFCSFQCSGRYNGGVAHVKVDKNHKYCGKCKRILVLLAFNKDKNRLDGLQPMCKFCQSLWTRGKGRKGVSYSEMMKMIENQKWKCAICGDTMKEIYDKPETLGGNKTKHFTSISIDHIVPGINKLQLAHQICNISKSNRNMEQLINWCNKVIKYEKI